MICGMKDATSVRSHRQRNVQAWQKRLGCQNNMTKEIKVETPHDNDGIPYLRTISLPGNVTLDVSRSYIGYISGDKKSDE